MRILVEVTHPAHVHFFRNAIAEWGARGHTVIMTSRRKDLTLELLDALRLDHRVLSRVGRGTLGLGWELAVRGARLLKVTVRDKPDVMVAVGGTFMAPVGWLTRTPSVVFTDTENAGLANAIAFPCATFVVTPTCYRGTLRQRHVRYSGYHELAYLHPRRFTPDLSILTTLGVGESEPYVVMRFVGWGASHDVGHEGLSLETKRKAVREFSKHARVFITSEAALPADLEQWRIRLTPERIHHALAGATLLYGESATMASECAVLGTPAIFLDNEGRGYTDEQEQRYGAVFNFTESREDQERSIAKGMEILTTSGVKDAWRSKRERLLAEKIDVTEWVVRFIEAVPEKLAKCAVSPA